MKEDWWKYVISVGVTILIFIATVSVNKITEMSEKINSLLITSTINREKIEAHMIDSEEWKKRIKDLETGNMSTTTDRITRKEVMEALEKQKEWVEKYYQRK